MSYSEVQTLAEYLISEPSITPNDHSCQKIMIDYLKTLGFEITPMPSSEVQNFWATYKHDSEQQNDNPDKKTLVFVGHTDVVPTGPLKDWEFDPFTPTIKDGLLYGRGAADMKGSLASMLVAVKNYIAKLKTHPKNYKNHHIAFMITSDEEGPAIHGTKHMVDVLAKQKQVIDYCIIGEPSSKDYLGDIIKNGRRGSLSGHLTIYGIQGHAAYPEKSKNAIHITLEFLIQLKNTIWDEGNQDFPPTSFQFININAGTGASNVIPGAIEIEFNFRYSTCNSYESLTYHVEQLLDEYGLKYDIEWKNYGLPFLTERGELTTIVQQAVTKFTNKPSALATNGGTSDGRFIFPEFQCQLIELGPKNHCIHQVNEHVSLDDLYTLSKIYEEILISLFAQSKVER